MNTTPDKIAVRIIPWAAPEIWGIAVDYRNGKHLAYQVGTRAEADIWNADALERGDRQLFRAVDGPGPVAGERGAKRLPARRNFFVSAFIRADGRL